MNRMLIFMVVCVFISCQQKQVETADNSAVKTTVMANNDTIGRVTGIGGIFFKSKDPKAQREWYAKNLGLETNEYGSLFEFREGANPEQRGYLQWSPFGEKTTYFEPSEREFMINYRVKNIEALIEQLKKEGVTICDSIEEYEYGKFVHIMDPEGNKLELWEPVDQAFTDMHPEGTTTK